MKITPHPLKLMLLKNGFKDISAQDFSKKLKNHFGTDVDERDLLILANQKEYNIDVKNKFIDAYPFEPYYIEEYIINEGSENEYNNKFITYNKIIFNDDLSAITSILQNDVSIEDIYLYFDYEKNEILKQIAIRNISYENFDIGYLQHLFLYNDPTRPTPIKNHHIDYIARNNKNAEDYFLTVIENIFSHWQEVYHNDFQKYELISILLEKILSRNENSQQKEKNRAIAKYIYDSYDDLIKIFYAHYFFHQKLLTKYSEDYNITKDDL